MYAGPGTQRTWWLLGYADKARARTLQTLEWCRQFSDPQSVAFVHVFAGFFYQYCGEPLEAERVADICIALCDEHGIVQEREWIAPVRGWALAKQGRIDEGLKILHASLERHRAMHSQLNVPYFFALLAEILLDANRLDEGLEAIDEALRLAEQTQMRAFLAEMYRVKGELLHARDHEDPDVKHLFWHALEIAERQTARALQLRAAMSLLRVSTTAAERTEARAVLERVYAGFTESFTTVDLVNAKAMLA